MKKTTIPIPTLRRTITHSFSWIDHRFIREGYLQKLSCDEIALYTFLVLVGNRDGVSFYRLEKICKYLNHMEWNEFFTARDRLIELGLIAFQPFSHNNPNGFYQVLSLDPADRSSEVGQ